MKFSIVTPVYNDPRLKSTLEGISSQRDVSPEVIVVDGQSTDDTASVIDEYRGSIDTLIREPDEGIYDAMNKGIKRARGDVIGVLNADDRFQDEFVLRDVRDELERTNADVCYGDLVYVDEQDEIVRYWESGDYQPRRFYFGWMPPHPTFFVRRELYERYGTFDLEFSIAADYELMLRFLLKHGASAAYVDRVLVRMAEGGKSNESLRNIVTANKEVYESWHKNDLSGGVLASVVKPLRKVGQFLRKPAENETRNRANN